MNQKSLMLFTATHRSRDRSQQPFNRVHKKRVHKKLEKYWLPKT